MIGLDLLHLFDDQRVVGGLEHDGLETLLQRLEDDEEGGDDEEEAEGADEHTADGAYADGAAAVGSCACGEHQGQHTENHRQRGHEDGAQTHLGGEEGTLLERHASMSALGGVVGEEDGGLAEQADEHDESHLQVDVVLHAEELGEEQGAHQSEGYAEDDGQGNEETLVECHHDEIDEEHTDEEDDDDVGARLTLLAGDARELDAVAHGQLLLGHLTDGTDGIAGAAALCHRACDADAAHHVEAAQRLRHVLLAEGDKLADGQHRTLGRAHKEAVERMEVGTVGRAQLHGDLIHLVVLVEVRHVTAAEEGTHLTQHSRGRHAQFLAARGIDVDAILRIVDGVAAVGIADLMTEVQRLDEALGDVEERAQVLTVLVGDRQFETATTSVAVNHAWRHSKALGLVLTRQYLVDALADSPRRMVAACALAPRTQLYLNHTLVGTTNAHNGAHALHFGHLLNLVGQPVRHLLGLRQRIARRRTYVNHQRTHILVGHKTRRHRPEQQCRQGEGYRHANRR